MSLKRAIYAALDTRVARQIGATKDNILSLIEFTYPAQKVKLNTGYTKIDPRIVTYGLHGDVQRAVEDVASDYACSCLSMPANNNVVDGSDESILNIPKHTVLIVAWHQTMQGKTRDLRHITVHITMDIEEDGNDDDRISFDSGDSQDAMQSLAEEIRRWFEERVKKIKLFPNT